MATTLQLYTQRYLYQLLGQEVECDYAPAPEGVKIGVRNRYSFGKLRLYGEEFLLCQFKEEVEWTPLRVSKDFSQLPHSCPVLLVGGLSATTRAALIKRGINFIDPGKQLHLPRVLLSLSDVAIKQHYKPRHIETLSPSAQCLLLCLYQDQGDSCKTVSDYALKLGYSKMTVHRCIRELVSKKLLKSHGRGSTTHYQVAHCQREGFLSILDHFKSPVSKVYSLAEFPMLLREHTFTVGESAIAECSDLISPRILQVAIGKKQWSEHKELIEECMTHDEALTTASLQVWNYSPSLSSPKKEEKQPELDKLSLYLSLREQADERVESALEQLLHNVTWSKD